MWFFLIKILIPLLSHYRFILFSHASFGSLSIVTAPPPPSPFHTFNASSFSGTLSREYFFKVYQITSAFSTYRQSAKLLLQSSELGLPHPLTRKRVCPPPPFVLRGGHNHLGEGGGGSQFRRGDIHSGTLYIYEHCGIFYACAVFTIFKKVNPGYCHCYRCA
jgi:hypothetical protein